MAGYTLHPEPFVLPLLLFRKKNLKHVTKRQYEQCLFFAAVSDYQSDLSKIKVGMQCIVNIFKSYSLFLNLTYMTSCSTFQKKFV